MKSLIVFVFSFLTFVQLQAQDSDNNTVHKLSGPRVGFTLLTQGSAADFINDRQEDDFGEYIGEQKPAFISQYGYQWETRFADSNEGIVGLVEWVILVGGLEKGLFLPSATSMFGIRASNGAEFALGPNLSFSGISYVLAIGKNFRSGKLNFPVNISYVPGKKSSWGDGDPTGHRFSITVGFNISK
jgi:hypothetical protein